MRFILEWEMQERLLAGKRYALPAAALPQRLARAIGFPQAQTKVTLVNVDTAGREVPSPSQKGFCVQWR